MKQLFAIFALTCTFLVPSHTVWAACTKDHPAKDLIQTTTKKVLDAITTDAANTESVLRQHVIPHFNWKKMSKKLLGKRKWKNATRDQRSRFIKAFQSLLVRTYKTSLKEEAVGVGFRVEYLPVCSKKIVKRRDGERVVVGERARVKARVVQGAKQVAVDFKMSNTKRTGNKWKAYDVYVEGISLLANYKNEFKSLTIEKAIERIQSKNRTAQ